MLQCHEKGCPGSLGPLLKGMLNQVFPTCSHRLLHDDDATSLTAPKSSRPSWTHGPITMVGGDLGLTIYMHLAVVTMRAAGCTELPRRSNSPDEVNWNGMQPIQSIHAALSSHFRPCCPYRRIGSLEGARPVD